MVRLIPLRLKPTLSSKKSRCIPPSSAAPAHAPLARSLSPSSPPIPPRNLQRLKLLRDVCVAPEPEMLPYTIDEWREVLVDVKRYYDQRMYKKSSGRSSQVLADIRGPVHPVHLIYLAFYTATCLEQLAGYQNELSAAKLSLLDKAISFFKHAQSFLEQAILDPPVPFSVEQRYHQRQASVERDPHHHRLPSSRPFSSKSTSNSSIQAFLAARRIPCVSHSESDSSAPVSPASSTESKFLDDHHSSYIAPSFMKPLAPTFMKPRPIRIRKKLAFEPTLPTVISVGDILEADAPPEGISGQQHAIGIAREFEFPVRKSSLLGRTSSIASTTSSSSQDVGSLAARTSRNFAKSPSIQSRTSSGGSYTSSRATSISSCRSILKTSSEASSTPPTPFLPSIHVRRYNTHLISVKRQIAIHIELLNADVSTLRTKLAIQKSAHEETKRKALFEQLHIRAGIPLRESNSVQSIASLQVHVGVGEESEEETKIRLRAVKIAALRKRGEERRKRGKWNGKRYEALSHLVLSELGCV